MLITYLWRKYSLLRSYKKHQNFDIGLMLFAKKDVYMHDYIRELLVALCQGSAETYGLLINYTKRSYGIEDHEYEREIVCTMCRSSREIIKLWKGKIASLVTLYPDQKKESYGIVSQEMDRLITAVSLCETCAPTILSHKDFVEGWFFLVQKMKCWVLDNDFTSLRSSNPVPNRQEW